MRITLLALLLGAGCDGIWGIHAITGTSDGAPDGSGQTCLGTAPFDVCVATPAAPLLLEGTGSNGYDTSQPPSTAPCVPYTGLLGADACVLAGTTVTVTNLGVIGDRPLVLVAAGDLTISAQLDVSSHVGVDHGPGADPVACVAGVAPKGSGAGGWGGSFGGMGGRGGAPTGATGGIPAAPSGVSALRGGCQGGPGNGTVLNTPGKGGGAVLLVAGGTIRIEGAVDASGAGGGGGDLGMAAGVVGGGCGGGAGGMIVLEAAQIDVETNGKLFANGGGGGQGGSPPTGGGAGASGGDSMGPTVPGAGGSSVSVAGAHGGAGAASPATDGTAGADVQVVQEGAGGGGGAVGVIVLRTASMTGVVSSGSAANVSPAPTLVPPP